MSEQQHEKTHPSEEEHVKGFLGWFIGNPVVANLLMFCILIAGILSGITIKKSSDPTLIQRNISIEVNYPGASPVDVEQSITVKIESALFGLPGIKSITSHSLSGVSQVELEIHRHLNWQNVFDQVESSINSLGNLPRAAERPIVKGSRPTKDIIWLAVYSHALELSQLRSLAQEFQRDLMMQPEINKVGILSDPSLIMSIEVSAQRLREYDLTFSELSSIIRSSSVETTAGQLEGPDGIISIQARGQAMTVEEFSRLQVRANPDGSSILLGDIANIRETFSDKTHHMTFDQENTMTLYIASVDSSDDLAIVSAIKNWVKAKRAELPETVKIQEFFDITHDLKYRLNMLLWNLSLGALLVFIILALFLRVSVACWVVIGMPLSFLGALWLMPFGPYPIFINMASLFGLILVLGLVVDDAIIVGESIDSEIHKSGHKLSSVLHGLKRVIVPAVLGVLTTMVAFAPLLTIGGSLGPYLESIAVAVVLCLSFSLLESKLILPSHLAYHTSRKPMAYRFSPTHSYLVTGTSNTSKYGRAKTLYGWQGIQYDFSRLLSTLVRAHYLPCLKWALRWRFITLSCFVGLLVITVGTLRSNALPIVMFPEQQSDFIKATITLEPGTSSEDRDKALKQVETAIYQVNEDYLLYQHDMHKEHQEQFEHNYDARKHSRRLPEVLPQDFNAQKLIQHTLVLSTSHNQGLVLLEMPPESQRGMDSYSVARLWHEAIGDIQGLQTLNLWPGTNISGGQPVHIQLHSQNLEQLRAAAQEIDTELKGYAGLYNITNSFHSGGNELRLNLNSEAQYLGVSLGDISYQLQQGFYGELVQRFQRNHDDIRVMLRYSEDERFDHSHLDGVHVRNGRGLLIPVQELASFEAQHAPNTIMRHNGQRSISISADIDITENTPRHIMSAINEQFIPDLLQRYPDVYSGLAGTNLEENEALIGLQKASLIALALIYILLAVALRSYTLPLIIMAAIPFGVIGALVGHLLLGLHISLFSLCGTLALAGVIVNDSLILVDFMHRGIQKGIPCREAIHKAASIRFRAILLTSVTTFLGLSPIMLENDTRALFIIPMAVSLGFGILFATLVTLYLVPILFDFHESIRKTLTKNKEEHVKSSPSV